MKPRLLTILILLILPMLLMGTIDAQTTAMASAEVTTGTTTRVSVAANGVQANGESRLPSISADGRYVAYISNASNLVPGDTNSTQDVFVHDRQTAQTSRVSVASDGTAGNSSSSSPSISADGRYVAFISSASNLVPGDTNSTQDAFVHDRQTGQIDRVSVASNGAQGNDYSAGIAISADGRFVAFVSNASNLIPSDTNGVTDVFVHDRQTRQTNRVSVASSGTEGNSNSSWPPSISSDGRYVAFHSNASNLVEGDTNSYTDIFVHDRQTGQTSRVSIASEGMQGNGYSYQPSISADGRYVAFFSWSSNLVPDDTNDDVDIFVHDRQAGETRRVSVSSNGAQGNNGEPMGYIAENSPSISADGRYVAFHSWGSHLVSGDINDTWDVFVHDQQTGQTSRISVASSGTEGNSGSWSSSISADGRYVAFLSMANNLVSGDTNGTGDIFVHDRESSSGNCNQANPNQQPVLLVHGWGGPDVLTDDEPGFAQLYQWMAADGYVEGCNLFYATGVTSTKTREQNRQAIQRNLRDAYVQLVLSNPQWRGHFDIIGHSYGGLNARFYLESDYYQEDRSYGQYGIHVDNLFTLGSPHGGTRIPQETYPGAGAIAGEHILAPFNLADFLSAAQLHRTAMDLYNFSHIQPSDVRYHLIGGDFLEQGNVPFAWRALYSPWFGHTGDIGVSLRSSRQLGINPLLQFRYPSASLT